jgi:hypothetical protein
MTLPPSCLEIWEPQPPGNLWACNRPEQGLLCLLTDSDYVRQQYKVNELLRFHGNNANHYKCWVSSKLKFETQSLLKTSLLLFRYNFGLNHYKQLSYQCPAKISHSTVIHNYRLPSVTCSPKALLALAFPQTLTIPTSRRSYAA